MDIQYFTIYMFDTFAILSRAPVWEAFFGGHDLTLLREGAIRKALSVTVEVNKSVECLPFSLGPNYCIYHLINISHIA